MVYHRGDPDFGMNGCCRAERCHDLVYQPFDQLGHAFPCVVVEGAACAAQLLRGGDGIYMECDDRLGPLDGSLAQQLVGTTREQFLGGLEDESHAAGEGGQFMEGLGDSDGNGGMGVVAAGVHEAGQLGGEWKPGLLVYGKSIEVGPKPNQGALFSNLGG